jgi:predicted nucleotidyltransferase
MDIQDIITEAASRTKRYVPKGTSVVLFGSWARGNALPTSDIDIGIMGKKKIPFETMIKIHQTIEEIPTLRSIDVVDLQSTDKRFQEKALQSAKFL